VPKYPKCAKPPFAPPPYPPMLSCTHVPFQVTNDAMSSSLIINAADTNATLDNGMYTCQITLTVTGEDDFTSTSDDATVRLQGM